MRIRTALLALAATALLPAAAIACGGDDVSPVASSSPSGSAASPSPTLTPDQRQLQTLLQGTALKESDLPAGFQQTVNDASTNESVADGAPDPTARLAQLQAFGRLLGLEVHFEPGPAVSPDNVVQGVQESMSLFSADKGAGDSLQEGLAAERSRDYKATYPGVNQLEVAEVARPIGDDGAWIRISGFDAATGRLVLDDQLAFRVGRARLFLRVASAFAAASGAGRDSMIDQVEQWAKLAADRLQAALSGGSPSSSS